VIPLKYGFLGDYMNLDIIEQSDARWCERRIPSALAGGTVYSMCAVSCVSNVTKIKMEEGPPIRIF
jgi:hypothetical protein